MNNLSRISVRARAAVALLEDDPTISVVDAADDCEVSPSTVLRYWHMSHTEMPRGRRQSRALVLREAMLRHVPLRDSLSATEIFAATINDYGSVCERTLYRALRWLVESGQVERVGQIFMSTYRRTATLEES